MLEWLRVVFTCDELFGVTLAIDVQTIAHEPHVKPPPAARSHPLDAPNPLHFFLFSRVLSSDDGFRMREYG
jgi:hypothetical protein